MNRGTRQYTRGFPEAIERTPDSKHYGAAENLTYQHVERRFPECLEITCLDLNDCWSTNRDNPRICDKMPERYQRAEHHALQTAAEYRDVAVIVAPYIALPGA